MPAAVLTTGAPFRAVSDKLPLFRRDTGADSLFYAPGYVVVMDGAAADRLEADLSAGTPPGAATGELFRHALAAQHTWEARRTRPYAPVCLTLYPNHTCNLACTYCFSEPTTDAARLDAATVQAAARIVAANCRTRGLPLTVVFHGGGEPSLNRRHADALLDTVEAAAVEAGVPIFRYIATNGMMAAEKACWLAQRFDLIGLSCDGPSDIQAEQRPTRGGTNSAPTIERTARVIHGAGKRLHVRVTITPLTLYRQAEIADYVCRVLRPEEVHVEPVYPVGRAAAGMAFVPAQAAAFVAEFWRARAVARAFGVGWLTTGSRPGEVHGAYCQVFRDVLHLVPGDAASACLRVSSADRARAAGVWMGGINDGRFEINADDVSALRDHLNADAPPCAACFNRFHCARGCPASCPLDEHAGIDAFRCQVQQFLTLAYIDEAANRIRARRRGTVDGEPVTIREMEQL